MALLLMAKYLEVIPRILDFLSPGAILTEQNIPLHRLQLLKFALCYLKNCPAVFDKK